MSDLKLLLSWRDDESGGYTDIFDLDAFGVDVEDHELEHQVLGPAGGHYSAKCKVRASGKIVDLDYGAYPVHNEQQGMYLGILRIHFESLHRQKVGIIEWQDAGKAVFKPADVTVVYDGGKRAQPKESIDFVYSKVEDKARFRQWLKDNANGYVLNWPKHGISASMHVVFHHSSCRVLKDRSFPSDSWQKVCSSSLHSLVSWANDRREFDKSPEVHRCGVCFDGESDFAQHLEAESQVDTLPVDYEFPTRVEFTTQRIVRDTVLARWVKIQHGMRCQLCRSTIKLPNGRFYAEAHHLKPLGGIHKGPDIEENILCVCPTCHVKLDYGVIGLDLSHVALAKTHSVGHEFIRYHNDSVYEKIWT